MQQGVIEIQFNEVTPILRILKKQSRTHWQAALNDSVHFKRSCVW